MSTSYPVKLAVDYPDRELNRISTFFRIFAAIPILFLLGAVSSSSFSSSNGSNTATVAVGAGGLLVFGPFLMILFRLKYPRWWFDWNLELMRFMLRVGIYLALMDDNYPSTDNEQAVHLDIKYPNATEELNRWLPLVKWFFAIPHYFVLVFLNIASVVVVIIAWFNILFTGHYPKSLFDFMVKVVRWNTYVINYAFILTTDKYPPFSFSD